MLLIANTGNEWRVHYKDGNEKLSILKQPWPTFDDALKWKRYLIRLKGKQIWDLEYNELSKRIFAADIRDMRQEAKRLRCAIHDRQQGGVTD